MPTTTLSASTTTTGVNIASGDDGTLTIKTGSTAGAQVNALSFAADGTGTFLNQPVLPQRLTLMTAQSTAAGNATPIDFTSVPSWVKRITVMFNGVSTNGTSIIQVQLGSGSVQTTGYTSYGSNGATIASSTTGMIAVNTVAAANAHNGHMILTLVSGNVWISSAVVSNTSGTTAQSLAGGSVTLSGALDRVRLTTVSGADFWDAGSVNIMYEG